ncbi:MAG TPA: ribbon-helix-helix domain-containing protein [Alphaproteobacteria bacterium]|nr:ribbon-helix-helix domain-containing protein [Alphaproteobacteria bacterium]
MTLRRHSVRIAGHATSISIEDEFWEEIQTAAQQDRISTARLIEAIDKSRTVNAGPGRKPPNLSSALRLYVLKRLKTRG